MLLGVRLEPTPPQSFGHESTTMNEFRKPTMLDWVFNECTKDECRLTKKQFETLFPGDAEAAKRKLEHFCSENDLELLINKKAKTFTFRLREHDE